MPVSEWNTIFYRISGNGHSLTVPAANFQVLGQIAPWLDSLSEFLDPAFAAAPCGHLLARAAVDVPGRHGGRAR